MDKLATLKSQYKAALRSGSMRSADFLLRKLEEAERDELTCPECDTVDNWVHDSVNVATCAECGYTD